MINDDRELGRRFQNQMSDLIFQGELHMRLNAIIFENLKQMEW